METMVKFGTPEPIIYKDPETLVSVSAKVIGTAEVYTTGATEGQTRDVIDVNVRQAVILGLVRFFDEMSQNSVPFSEVQLRIPDAQKAITASVKNAGYGVGTVIIHSINCDEAGRKAMENVRNNTYNDAFPVANLATSATISAAPYATIVPGPADPKTASATLATSATTTAAGPKFCPNCGAPTNGAKFCSNCGNRLI